MEKLDIARVNEIEDKGAPPEPETFEAGAQRRKIDRPPVKMRVKALMTWSKVGVELRPGDGVEVYFTQLSHRFYYMYLKGHWLVGRIVNGHKYVSGINKPPSMKTLEKYSWDGISKTVTGHRTEPDGYGPDNSPSWLLVMGMMEGREKRIVKEIFAQAVKEVFTEGIQPAHEEDVRGVLGFPFDKYIVKGSIKMDDHDVDPESKFSTKETYTYMWQLLVPVDDPEIMANLDESQETFEEKVVGAITKRLRSIIKPGEMYTTGFAEVEARKEINNKKFLLIKVEMTVGWDV